MRGLYTAMALHTLMKRFTPSSDSPDLDIGKGFDLIVGTSTGGILACALAFGKRTQDIIDLYCTHGEEIFRDPMPSGKVALSLWAARNLTSAPSSSGVLRSRLDGSAGVQGVRFRQSAGGPGPAFAGNHGVHSQRRA